MGVIIRCMYVLWTFVMEYATKTIQLIKSVVVNFVYRLIVVSTPITRSSHDPAMSHDRFRFSQFYYQKSKACGQGTLKLFHLMSWVFAGTWLQVKSMAYVQTCKIILGEQTLSLSLSLSPRPSTLRAVELWWCFQGNRIGSLHFALVYHRAFSCFYCGGYCWFFIFSTFSIYTMYCINTMQNALWISFFFNYLAILIIVFFHTYDSCFKMH